MQDFLANIRQSLIENSDEKTRTSSQRYFKEEIKVHGIKAPVTRQISKQYFQEIKNLPKSELFAL